MLGYLEVIKSINLTGDFSNNPCSIMNGTSVTINAIAKDTDNNVIDLINILNIEVHAKKRITSTSNIFTASLSNNKIAVVNATGGLYNIILNESDTQHIGDAVIQAKFTFNDNSICKSMIEKINFLESLI
jgi:hypothetical protein